ncbi:MAG: hypothetical protein K2X47_18720, partial [Bdellovibrionales bacterium]|nr:hypothetical protein [Bdellovibrionales bacterium]
MTTHAVNLRTWVVKTSLFLLLFLLVGCSSGKESRSVAAPNEALVPDRFKSQVGAWSSSLIKDCTPQSVLDGGGKGPFLDADLLKEKLKPTSERTLVTSFPFISPTQPIAGAPSWILFASEDQHVTALRSGKRCMIRWKGDLIAEANLATQIEVLADFNPSRGEVQFESKPRSPHPHLTLLQSHPLPDVLFLALKPDASTFRHISTLTGLSEEQLRPWIQWRSPLNQPDWQIRFKGVLKDGELGFTTSSSEALVPSALLEIPTSLPLPVAVRIPQTSSNTLPSTFSFLVTLKSSEDQTVRAIAIAQQPTPTQSVPDGKMAQDCFFGRWDHFIGANQGNQALKAINMETLVKPCLGWNSRLYETLLATTPLRDRFRNLIARDLLRNPESRAAWTPSLLQYLKFHLDAGSDLVLQLDPQKQDPMLLEVYRSQTLLRAELSSRPQLLSIASELENIFLKWALNGSQFEHDAVVTLLLAADRAGHELQAPYLHWLSQNPTLPLLNAPEIDFALRMRPDLRGLITKSVKLAQRMEWNQWLSREYQNVFRGRRSYTYWVSQLKFLETLNLVFEASGLPPAQQALIAETILQSTWRAAQPEATWQPGSAKQLAQALLVVMNAFPERGFAWLEARKRTGILSKDAGILEMVAMLSPEHLKSWNQRMDAAIVLGVKPSMERVIQEIWKGERSFEESFPIWTEADRSRFISWKDFFASHSHETIGYELRTQLLARPARWTAQSRLDALLQILPEVADELMRWKPASAFRTTHLEIVLNLASRPETLWKTCDEARIKTNASSILSLMKTYRDA